MHRPAGPKNLTWPEQNTSPWWQISVDSLLQLRQMLSAMTLVIIILGVTNFWLLLPRVPQCLLFWLLLRSNRARLQEFVWFVTLSHHSCSMLMVVNMLCPTLKHHELGFDSSAHCMSSLLDCWARSRFICHLEAATRTFHLHRLIAQVVLVGSHRPLISYNRPWHPILAQEGWRCRLERVQSLFRQIQN